MIGGEVITASYIGKLLEKLKKIDVIGSENTPYKKCLMLQMTINSMVMFTRTIFLIGMGQIRFSQTNLDSQEISIFWMA